MPDHRPNILIICTDQQHWRMMSCAGNPHVHTPAMDRLAAVGTRFERVYCANPVCVPSRFTMFTGHMPSAIDMRGITVPHAGEPLPTYIERGGLGWLLQRAGYRCLYGGKQHLPRTTAEKLGFEIVTIDERDQLADTCADIVRRPLAEPFCLVGSFVNPHDICYMAIGDSLQSESERKLWQQASTERAALEDALKRPADVDDDATFFTQHCPPLPPNFEPQTDEPEAITHLLADRPFRVRARRAWSEQRWREHRWAYARLTESVDRQIGRVVDALDESSPQRDTVIIFLSDHGDMDAAHRMEHKSTFYEEAARVPLIVRDPSGASVGQVNDRDVVSAGLDLIPTCCDYAGIDPPAELEGRSLRPLIEGRLLDPPRCAVKLECQIARAVITRRYKYVRCDEGAHAEQLYDLEADPHETRNAADDAAQQDALIEHRALFDEMFDVKTNASVPRTH
ncbi:MAG: sulfatase [bacterium]